MSVNFWRIVSLVLAVATAVAVYMNFVAERKEKEKAAQKTALSGKLTAPKKEKKGHTTRVKKDSIKLRSADEILKEIKEKKPKG